MSPDFVSRTRNKSSASQIDIWGSRKGEPSSLVLFVLRWNKKHLDTIFIEGTVGDKLFEKTTHPQKDICACSGFIRIDNNKTALFSIGI